MNRIKPEIGGTWPDWQAAVHRLLEGMPDKSTLESMEIGLNGFRGKNAEAERLLRRVRQLLGRKEEE